MSNELVVTVQAIDSQVKATSLPDKLINDRYLRTSVQRQRFYIVRYPLGTSSNQKHRPGPAQMFYSRSDGNPVEFRIASNGLLLRSPVSTNSTNGRQWSFTFFDPQTHKDVGPIYNCDQTLLCFNQSSELFVANARGNSASLLINGKASGVDGLYSALSGTQVRSVGRFNLGGFYGTSEWVKLTSDWRYYVFFRKGRVIHRGEQSATASGAANNECLIQDTEQGSHRLVVTSNIVTQVENMGTQVLFLCEDWGSATRKPLLFEEGGQTMHFPGVLPFDFRTMNWDPRGGRITFVRYPHFPEENNTLAEPIRTITWHYNTGMIEERDFECEAIQALSEGV